MRFEGIAYRILNPIYANEPTSGEGARLTGGRFNRVGVPALYLSTTVQGAANEAAHGLRHKFDPVTICSFDVDCQDIVDLSTSSARTEAGISLRHMSCAWRDLEGRGLPVPSWDVADRLFAEGAAGILVPSFAVGATRNQKNLVLWRWSSRRPHRVRAYDPEGRLAARS